MSGLLDQAGLTAGSGLSNGAGLYKWGNFNPFDPTDLDPFLLFDTGAGSMIGTLENPTLDLDPSNQETLDVITATRAGVATFTDVNGLIASAPANTVRVDQTQGAELTPTKFQRIGYTDFSQGWGNANSTFVDGSGFSGNASKILTGTSSSGAVDTGVVTADGVTYTGSFYIRRVNGTGNLEFAIYGSASSDVTPLFTESVSTDWVRVDLQFLGKSGGGNVFFGVKMQTNGDSVEIAMPQVEEGTTASDFVANTSGSAKFISSAEYGPRVPMVLIEPSATNLLTATQEASSWSSTNVSVTSNTTTAPDGSQTGDTVTRTAGGADVRQTKAVTSGTSYTMSIFAKAETDNQIQLDFSNSSMGADNVEFNTRTGQKVSGSANYSITQLSNGWRRYSFTSTCISSGNTGVIIRIENDEPVELWGFQFEEGSVATSYIPTSGSTVTRAQDSLVISGSDFSSFYNQSAGTVYTEAVGRGYLDFNTTIAFSNNTSGESIYQRTPSNNQVCVIIDGSVVQAGLSSSQGATGTLVRKAFSFKLNNFKGSQDGADITPDTSGTIPTVDRLHIGASATGHNKLNGHIKRVIYWPYHSDSL